MEDNGCFGNRITRDHGTSDSDSINAVIQGDPACAAFDRSPIEPRSLDIRSDRLPPTPASIASIASILSDNKGSYRLVSWQTS